MVKHGKHEALADIQDVDRGAQVLPRALSESLAAGCLAAGLTEAHIYGMLVQLVNLAR